MVFQHGTALHLALLTVAPLFLQAFCKAQLEAVSLTCLSVFAILWVIMNPSPRAGEWPRDARHRIGWELVRDPFLLFCVVAIVIAAIRAINGGVELSYSAQSGLWRLTDPYVTLLPGSVSGCGVLSLAGLLSLATVTLGVRHALGSRARFSYLFLSGALAALTVVCWWALSACGVTITHLKATAADPFGLGSLLGAFFILSLAAWAESLREGNPILEICSILPAAVLLTGLLLYAPTYAIWAFGIGGLLTVGAGVFLFVRSRARVSWFRLAVALLILLTPVALVVCGEIARPTLWPIFPKGFWAVRAAASSVATEAWREATRFGVGPGAYPLAIGFFASPEDWKVLSAVQTAAPNGWLHFIFERGILGSVVFLVGLGLLLKDMVFRYIRAGSSWSLRAVHLVGLLVFAPVVAVLFFECSYVQIEAMLPVGAALALTAAAFPGFEEENHG